MFYYNVTRISGTLQEDQYTFLLSRSVLLRMRNVSDKFCTENQNMCNNLFSKIVPFMK